MPDDGHTCRIGDRRIRSTRSAILGSVEIALTEDPWERWVSFKIPDGLSEREVLDHGWIVENDCAVKKVHVDEVDSTLRKLEHWLSFHGQK